MNHFFSFHNKKFYFRSPEKKPISNNKNVALRKNMPLRKNVPVRNYFVKPRHSFREGLLTRLANPAGCGCGK